MLAITREAYAIDEKVMAPVKSSSHKIARFLNSAGTSSYVLEREDIDGLQVATIEELISTVSSVEFLVKGAPGSQYDVSIRGSSAEDVLVMVNGIPYRDPQTAHFTMDVPISLASVERVEILAGGASSQYGSSASGGIINIVTADLQSRQHISTSYGSHETLRISGTTGVNGEHHGISATLLGGRTEGYISGTDNEYLGFDAAGRSSLGGWNLAWNTGYQKKDFGAALFYGPYRSYESTETIVGGVYAEHALGERSLLRFRSGLRGHADDFILDRDNPSLYRNTHYNRSYHVNSLVRTLIGENFMVLAGGEAEHAGITSGTLGSHSLVNFASFGELNHTTRKTHSAISLRYDTGFHNEHIFTPGIGFEYALHSRMTWRIRGEQSFRSPTFTELYYNSPANIGNPDLDTQKSTSGETAIVFKYYESYLWDTTLFIRQSNNVIDWIREGTETIWRAENHGRVMTQGIESSITFPLLNSWQGRLSGTVLDQKTYQRRGVSSKYALNPAKRRLTSALYGKLPLNMNSSIILDYSDMAMTGDHTILNLGFSRRFGAFEAAFRVRNAFDVGYEEIPGLPAPGRWLSVVCSADFQ